MPSPTKSEGDQGAAKLQGQKGFTLVEVLVVLAVLSVLAGIVIPQVAGITTRSKKNAWKADWRTLQAAVTGYYNEENAWPTVDSASDPASPPGINGSDSWIDVAALATRAYLRGARLVRSADTSKNTTATNSPSGSYGWYIDSNGRVKSEPTFTTGLYP